MRRTTMALIALFLLITVLAYALFAASAAVVSRDFSYPSRGISVPATLTAPRYGGRHPVVIMAHGHHGTRDERFGFSAIADALARSGVASIRMDFPGCGESAEPFTANTLTHMKADLRAAVLYARDVLHAPAIGLFGYSMGGRAVLECAAEGVSPDAIAMLAPAADTDDLKRVFGGAERFSLLHETARQTGAAALTELETVSLSWFDDLYRYDDPAAAAASAYSGPALILYGSDDTTVPPHVSLAAAKRLGADTLDVSGRGHGYGFFREDDELLACIAQQVSAFFRTHLCN